MATEIKQLNDARSIVTLVGVKVSFLQHHGVTRTIQHIEALGLPCTIETIAEIYLRLTALTATSGNFNNTIRTARTPNSSRCCVLEHLDARDIFGVYLEECSKLLLVVEVIEVER